MTKTAKIRIALAAVLAVCAISGVALARSGGSFGGGFRSSSSSRSFGSSSSSRSFGSSSSSSSYRPSSSYSSSSYGGGGTRYVPVPVPVPGSTYHYGAYSPGYSSYRSYGYYRSGGSFWGALVAMIIVGIILFIIVVAIVKAVRNSRSNASSSGDSATSAPAPSNEKCDVWLVQLGVQMAARDIQDTLEAMAAKIDPNSEDSLSYALRTLAQNLQDRAESVEYAAVRGTEKLQMAKAEDQFQLWSGNERAKFNREVIRGSKSGVQRSQKEWQTDGIRDEDGQLAVAEFFVVSVVLASRGVKLPRQVMGGDSLNGLLQALGGVTGAQLVALEVVWSPAARSDAMSRQDMEGRYPELAPV